MAALDKLVKALEGLKIIKESSSFTDESVKCKEKAALCVTVADLMCSSAARNAPKLPYYLSYSMETLLHMCDDPDSDIRMTADESLNRIIRAMMENNIVKVQVELHKEIKKNGNARSLRAALWRFAELAHMIRPQKGKPYVQNLVPCIIQIAKRTEEPVLETLAAAMPKIFAALGCFTTDNDVKSLLRTFLANIASEHTVVRRTAATSILAICLHCRKSQIFLCYTLNTILDSVLPVRDDQPVSDILGVLNLSRQLLLHLDNCASPEDKSFNNNSSLSSSYGTSNASTYPSIDRFIQIYELSLHWSNHQDHNVVTASLEVLQQLLTCASSSPCLANVFVSSSGLSHSRVLPSDNIAKFSTTRTLSEMSVSTASIMQGDESTLLDATEDCVVKSRLEQWMQDSVPHDFPVPTMECNLDDIDQQQQDYVSGFESDCMSSPKMTTDLSMQRAPSLESEQLLGRDESPTPPPSEISADTKQVWDIGSVLDTDPTLVYCARHLAAKFLCPDQGGPRVRVSVRALALSCLSQVINLMPRVFLMNVARRYQATVSGFSHISDVLIFATHADQQLRGLTMTLIGYIIRSTLYEGRASFSDWSNGNLSTCDSAVETSNVISCASSCVGSNIQPITSKPIELSTLLSFLIQGLEDESAICVRHTLAGVETCLGVLLSSKDSKAAVPLLHAVADLTNNPYWLIKVKVVELLSGLNYMTISYVIGNNSFQDKVLHSVMFTQLTDQDNRVRKATAEAIARFVENLFYPVDHNQEDIVTTYGLLFRQKILSGLFDQDIPDENDRPNPKIEAGLSRIVSSLSYLLLQSTSKYLAAGCCETLGLLSSRFPCSVYRRAWQCKLGCSTGSTKSSSPSAGLIATVMTFLTSAPISHDLDSHYWLLLLAGNLYAGLAESALQAMDLKTDYDKSQLWSVTGDKKFAVVSEQLLLHVMRMLSVFVLVLEDQRGQSPRGGLAPSPVKRRPSRPASPAKSSTAPSTEKEALSVTTGPSSKEEKGKPYGYFSYLPHYCRLHDILASAYKNYKVTLEGTASEKFVNLLKIVLTVLGQLLEYCGLLESGRIAEEILHYLRVTVVLDATTSVFTVQQLLKSLFGANYLANWEDERERGEKRTPPLSVVQDTYTGFYGNVFQQPYQKLSDYLEANSKICNEIPRGGPSYVRERATAPKNMSRNSDKAALASYIRLFEPMVIQALKKYTVTSDVSLQMAVLELLTQLVRLRVNYCLLDSDQIFINFIFKQFEFLEEGQILRANELIPKLFKFLVHLSHEKNHSKPVISFPRVIQLCAGLMASGQNPLTHCIPALFPVVEHVFLANVTNLADAKELETQREFLISMLLRLAEYPQVLQLLGVILKEGWRWEERWRKWSRLTADTVLPTLAQDKVLLDTPDSLSSLLYLINSLAPGTLRPVDQILKVLFNTQQPQNGCSMERWLRIILAMIVALVCQGKEDSVLSRLEELQLCVHQQGDDPLNVTAAQHNHPPQLIFANLLLHVIESVMGQIETLNRRSKDVSQFEHLFSHFLLCCLVMFQSGSYLQVLTALIDLVGEPEGLCRLEMLNAKFEALASSCPLLTLLWSYLLTLINYGKTSYWSALLQTRDRDKIGGRRNPSVEIQPEQCLHLEVVRRGATIFFCDYVTENISDSECLTWLMIGHIEELVRLSSEPPVQELLASVHRNPAASGLMVQAVSTRCSHITQVRFLCKLLACLETVHPRDSGAVLKLLAPDLIKHPHLVISRRSMALASRRTEFLLTLDKFEVMQQISKDDLQKLLESLSNSYKSAIKHSGLISLLNKLGAQCFDLSPVELDQGRQVNTANIRTIKLDRDWFLTQVKLRCCGRGKNGPQCALLLSQLSEEDIVSVLRSQNFDNSILQHCFNLGTRLTLEACKIGKSDKVILSPLFTAARLALLHHVDHMHSLLPRVHQVYNPVGRQATTKEVKYKERIDELLCDPEFLEAFFHLVPAVSNFLQSISDLEEKTVELLGINNNSNPLIPKESLDALSKFSVLCIESIVWLSLNKSLCGGKWPNCLHKALECIISVVRIDRLMSLLSVSHVGSIVSCIVSIIHKHTNHTIKTPSLQGESESVTRLHSCYQMAMLIKLMEKSPPTSWDVPQLFSSNIGKLITCMGRSATVNWHCRTPLEGWGPPDPGPPPVLSPHLLQDIEILNLVVFRMLCLGWTSRQQFEESWMTLLSVVRANSPLDQIEPEQAASIIQGNSLTVKALTSLLLQTTLLPNPGNPGTGRLLHCPRDEPIDLSSHSWGSKLLTANDALCWKLKELDRTSCSNIQLLKINERPNIERRIGSQMRYGYGQVSVNYMKTAVMSVEERSSTSGKLCQLFLEQEQRLTALSLDVRSCIQFLLDLYSEWTQPSAGLSLNVLLEIVRSTLCVSDLFFERSHFSWMLDTCLELSHSHPQEDEIMHQYLVLAVCKAASVLPALETEVTDRVLKLLDNSLKGNFHPTKLAAVHGLLYLLQSQLMVKTDSEIIEQKTPVVDTRQKLIQLSVDFISKNVSSEISADITEESLVTVYALAFYLLEHSVQDMPQDTFSILVQLAQNAASSKVTNIYITLIQGIDRLVLVSNNSDIRAQATRLATEIFVHTNPATSMPALQLLLSCIYSGEYEKGKERQVDSEVLVAAIEKLSTLFNRIKWAYPVEAECVCIVLPHLLGDFFPASEVLSKVIGEFLAPKQPHPQLISPVVFQVFSQACSEQQLPLLQAWVVMSLPNFTQGIPVPIATWCLSCFFISASTNPWLRSLFPHVQSRIGRCTYEDKKLLCIAASDFYNQLSDISQKETFLRTFTEAASIPKSPFSDIIACISQT
ncbi:huntingtin isoform X2 [Lycorma delicatula]|uniref:huntingtin isoform X2 n=1 Tax=Lycorma delicatula TaxID=130591 RepID=UPI003F51079A